MRALSPPGVSLPPNRGFGPCYVCAVKLRLTIIAGCALVLVGCTATPKWYWPFHKKAKPAPEAVHELDLVNADGSAASFPQYWKRNTLVIDLSGVSGTGAVTARLPAETTWPVRVAVRVQPGSVEQVEIQGEERNVMAVSREGTLPIDLEFAPSVYRPNTAAIYINWGFMPQFAVAVVEPEPDATFVSPTEVPNKPATPEGVPAPAAEPAPGPDADHLPDVPPPPGTSDRTMPEPAAEPGVTASDIIPPST